MKKLIFFTLTTIAAITIFGRDATRHGTHEIVKEIAVFNATDQNTKILLLADTVWRDSSGTWVRIDAGADSCSQPIELADTTRQLLCGDWISVSMTVKSVDADSVSAHEWHVHSRFFATNLMDASVENWAVKGKTVAGDGIHTIKDSILTVEPVSTGWERQHHMIWVQGHQIRLCPEELSTTDHDSVFVDSVTVRCR